MKILAVDDEPLALNGMVAEITKAQPGCDISSYTDPIGALALLEKRIWMPNAAFLDIEMPGIGGLTMATRIKTICPECNIIFATSYSQYALNALNLHASGYLIKPILAEDIRRELDDLRRPVFSSPRIKIHTFGNFDVIVDNAPLHFARSKSKEALAYIVSRNGGSVTTAELAAVVWETRNYNRSLQNRTQTIISDMMKALRKADIADIIIKTHNNISLDVTKVDCDYYNLLKGDITAVNSYTGEFMTNFSWAEMIAGYLSNR